MYGIVRYLIIINFLIFITETSVDRKIQLQSTVQRLSEVTEELRKFQRLSEEDRERERAKRTLGLRRFVQYSLRVDY